jgi:phage shock protein B
MIDTPFVWYLSGPLIVFLVFVLPLWIVFHYLTKWKQMKQEDLGEGRVAIDKQELLRLRDTAVRLEQRIRSLEKILDEESPGWRSQ